MVKARFGGLALAAAVALTAPAAVDAAEWKFALEEAIHEVQGVYATKFKEVVEAESGGEITVTIYPYGTLGESADVTELTQAGVLQLANASPGFTGSIIPEVQVFSVPYLLPEDDAVLNEFFRNSELIREDFDPLFEQQGLAVVDFYPEGEFVMTTKEPVRSRDDLDGVKFRVMTSPLLVETYNAFGATPTPLPWGEVYSSLQLNMIGGQENPMFFVESTKMYEVTDYIVFTGHNTYTTTIVGNLDWYNGLSEEERAILDLAQIEAFEHILDYQKTLAEDSLEKILEAKPEIEVIRLSDAEREPFREAAAAVEAKFVEMAGGRAAEVLEQFKADVEAARAAVE
ncbi:MAG: C4-dicarboxylate ABC transporter [Alphaproteobacteria bacterium]|jgi:tripartite ATP-independent transporter DctP family solute receptor|nr:C4-dicarboxylate ABC transporter [Alphaproteobacteria bacterium]